MQASQEDSFKRQSSVQFVRHLFKSPKATRSRDCPHLIISTDWWMFSLLKMAAHRPRNAAVVTRTTPLPLTVSLPKLFLHCLLWSSSTPEDHKSSSQCVDKEITSARCSRVDPQTRHVFTAISRKSTAGILLRRMQSSHMPQVQCS